MIVLIIGLPGSGKTTLSKEICRRTDAIHINADDVRSDLSSDLGFMIEDRIEQSRRLGAIARLLSKQDKLVLVDFVNPTKETRAAFGHYDFMVVLDRIKESRFKDTNRLWEFPKNSDLVIPKNMSVQEEAKAVMKMAKVIDWTEPTTLMLGRYQPWHDGHEALKNEAHKRTDQVLIGVRNTQGTSEKDPLSYKEVVEYINNSNTEGVHAVMKLPNITNIVYGRDVGYSIEYIDLPPEIQAISATQKRKEMGI